MDITETKRSSGIRELNSVELENVGGGLLPVAWAAFYVSGFAAGVGAGWAWGNRYWRIP